jgi:hypothetical protein
MSTLTYAELLKQAHDILDRSATKGVYNRETARVSLSLWSGLLSGFRWPSLRRVCSAPCCLASRPAIQSHSWLPWPGLL